MAKSKRSSQRGHASEKELPAPKEVFDSPFKQLRKLYAGKVSAKKATPATPPPPTPVQPEPPDESQMLLEALRNVRPLGGPRHAPPACEPGLTRTIVTEDAEVLAELSDLVTGQGEFDITETEEYVEGARVGLDPRLIVRLRRGEFPVEAHLDLHGMTQADSKQALTDFIPGIDPQRPPHRSGRSRARFGLAGRASGAQACHRQLVVARYDFGLRAGLCHRAPDRRRRRRDLCPAAPRPAAGKLRRA